MLKCQHTLRNNESKFGTEIYGSWQKSERWKSLFWLLLG